MMTGIRRGVPVTVVATVILCLAGCATSQYGGMKYGGEPVAMKDLEGTWMGEAESELITANSTCTFKIRMGFGVENGRAVSLCDDPRCEFDVPLGENGRIGFRFRNAMTYQSDYGGEKYKDIVFKGRLASEMGGGTFSSSGCVGVWEVTKQ
ncbi:MAG: hypothetical protein GY703_21890 [Gammaproteobacteria bacterium]|nr:hypothetical protein [Gammaproteobacteria bacterium]